MVFKRPISAALWGRGHAMAEIVKVHGDSFGSAIPARLSLAAKLSSIFALFGVLIGAITALSDYNTRRHLELTEAVETASRAALNVERVNSLVYAVVMESRGVYMSTEATAVKKFGDGLLKFNGEILAVVKDWESIVQADDAQQFAVFKKRIEQFVEFRIPIEQTRSARWRGRSVSSRRRWTATATSIRKPCKTPGRVKNGPSTLKPR